MSMGISFKPLWKLLIDRDMKKKDLMEAAKLSPTIIARMSKNEPIGTRTLEKICGVLDCQPGDVLEYVPD